MTAAALPLPKYRSVGQIRTQEADALCSDFGPRGRPLLLVKSAPCDADLGVPDAVLASPAWKSATDDARRAVVALVEELTEFENGRLGIDRSDLAALAGIGGKRLACALRDAERVGLIKRRGFACTLTFADTPTGPATHDWQTAPAETEGA